MEYYSVTKKNEIMLLPATWMDSEYIVLLQPHVLGNKLTQKDNADTGVQFITPAGPRQSALTKELDQHL